MSLETQSVLVKCCLVQSPQPVVCVREVKAVAETENGEEWARELISALASCDFSSFPSSLRSGFMQPSCRSCSQKLVHNKVT